MTKLYHTIIIALAAVLFAPAAYAEHHYEETIAYAPVEGGQMEYVVSGPEDAETIVFIHGSMVADTFAPIMRDPALADFRKVRVHLMNYMGSFGAGAATGEAAEAAYIVAVLDQLGVDSAHFVGHSLGGGRALAAASLFPDRVKSLVLAESAGFPFPLLIANGMDPDVIPPRPADSQLIALYQAGNREAALETALTSILGDDWRDFVEAVPGGWQQALSDYGRYFIFGRPGPEFSEAPDEIAHPALVLWGSDDPFWRSASQAAAAVLQNARGVEIPDTDHALIVQKPAEIAQLIAEFVIENE